MATIKNTPKAGRVVGYVKNRGEIIAKIQRSARFQRQIDKGRSNGE